MSVVWGSDQEDDNVINEDDNVMMEKENKKNSTEKPVGKSSEPTRYLKILSVDPAGVRTRALPHDSPMLNQLSRRCAVCDAGRYMYLDNLSYHCLF